MDSWSISEAKSRFSELVSCVTRDGPQTVTRNGEAVALIVSPQLFKPPPPGGDYWRLPRVHQPGLTLSDADIDDLFLSARTHCAPTSTPTLGAPAAVRTLRYAPGRYPARRYPPGKGLRALVQAYAMAQP